jgi:hypothetical protein
MIRRLCAAALLLACAACGAEPPADEPGAATAFRAPGADSSAPAADTQPGEAYLVWSAAAVDSPARTVWIDGQGRPVAQRAGVVAGGSGGLWAWTEGKETTRGVDCECLRNAEDPDNAQCLVQGEVATVHLADLLSGRRVGVVAAEPSDENALPEQRAAPLAGVGPYLFVEADYDVYSCGAHGFHNVEARVYDLSRGGAVVELLDSAQALAVEEREGVAARRALEDEFDDDDWVEGSVESVYLTEVEAKWTQAGTLDVAYQLTTGACYACSDGLSSSYSRSAVVPASSVPPALAEWTRAPEAVRRYWQATPPGERAGWSRVDAADPAAALARFRRP